MQLNTGMRNTRSTSEILRDQGARTRAGIMQDGQVARNVEREHWHAPPTVHTNLLSIQQLNPTLPVAHSTISSVQPWTIASPVFSTPSSVQQPTPTLPTINITSPLILQPIVVPAMVQRLSFSPSLAQPNTSPLVHPNIMPPIQPSTTLPTQATYSPPLVQSNPLGQLNTSTRPLRQVMPTGGFSMRPRSSWRIIENHIIDVATISSVQPNSTPPLHPNTIPSNQTSTTLLAQATYNPPLTQSTQLGQANTNVHPLHQHMPTWRFSMRGESSSHTQEEDAYIDDPYDSMEEDPTGVENILAEEPLQYDDAGRVIIFPHGTGWIPNGKPVRAIYHVIKSNFEGPYHVYEALSDDMKEKWWTEFKEKITWAPHHEREIREIYDKRVKRCLRRMLNKVRRKGTKPHWIGEAAWIGLVTYWESQENKDNSSQNQTNRASAGGEAVDTTGPTYQRHKSYTLISIPYQPMNPEELFTGGRTGGQSYGTGPLPCCVGASYPTQGSRFGASSSGGGGGGGRFQHSGEIDALRQEAKQAAERADAAAAQADAATRALAEANHKYAHLEEQLKLVQEQLCMVLDRQYGGTETGTSQVPPNYADDHPLDEDAAPAP